MKLNRIIAQLLSAGILLNNIYFYSNANTLYTEIPNRYQTLEGKYIAIDDSTEGELLEIEIFGNTIQDENNPEDIQSVGDLYIDKDGNPILDSKGREQYKIDIVNQSKNLFDIEDFKKQSLSNIEFDDEGYLLLNKSNFQTYEVPKTMYDPRKTYTFSAITNKNEHGIEDCIALEFYYTDGTYNQVYIGAWGTSTTSNSQKIIDKILVRYPWAHVGYDAKIKDIQLEESTIKTDFKEYTESINFILIPEQLYKVDNVSDKLYWNKSNNEYLIEKNIIKFDITNPEIFGLTPFDYSRAWGGERDTTTHNLIGVGFRGKSLWADTYGANFIIKSSYKILPFHTTVFNKGQSNEYCYLVFGVEKGAIDNIGESQQVKNFVMNNMSDIFLKKESSEIIKVPISKEVNFPTYDDKTYIYTESDNIANPTLKITIDRLPSIAKNAIKEAILDSSTANISLARMYVNMLPESTYKDQLQERLSEVFNSDITLDRKSATANLDIYIKNENILSLSLNTNNVTFENYSGVEDMEIPNAINISINSSLPYSLNAYIPSEIQNSNKSETMPIDMFNIKEGSQTNYKQFANTIDRIVLKDNCDSGNNNIHNIDLKLASNQAHKPDVYKTTIKFEAVQK